MPRDKTGQVIDAIRTAILGQRYLPGEAIPSERLLMEQFQVSRTTVRRAIHALIQEGMLTRRAGAGTFVSDMMAGAGDKISGPPTLGFVIPTFADPIYGEMVNGIEQEARGHEMRVLAGQSEYRPSSEGEHLSRYAADPAVRGAILVPSSVGEIPIGVVRYMRSGKPLVFLGRWPQGAAADCISSNYALGGALATQHLIELGHRHIAYIEGTPHLPGFSSYDGYERALHELGLAVEPELVRRLDLPGEEAGLAGAEALLGGTAPFTAVFARNDATALGVCRALKRAGLSIPEDVSVASFNNSIFARHMEPPLTSIDPSPTVLGQEAFRMLLERIEGRYVGPPRRVLVDPRLVVRASTAQTGPRRHMAGSRSFRPGV